MVPYIVKSGIIYRKKTDNTKVKINITKNYLQKTTQKTKEWATYKDPEVNVGTPEG